MSRDSGEQSDESPNPSSEASGQEPGLLEMARMLEHELRGLVHDHISLAALETRQAGESLVRILAMGVIAGSLVLTAWLALVSAVVIVLVQHSLTSAGHALMMVFAVHCLLAILSYTAIRRRSRDLLFPASIDQLEPAAKTCRDEERSS